MSALEDNNKDLPDCVSLPPQQSTSRTKRMSRRKSLRLLTAPDIPIPPSLQHSPYLTSPIFIHSPSSPSLPSDEDEKWLQDTIPIVPSPRIPIATEGGSPSGRGSMDRRGSISRRAAQKTDAEMITEESRNPDCNMYATARTDLLAPPSLLLVPDAHRATAFKERRSSTANRRRWSTSPQRPVVFNLEDTLDIPV